MGAEIEPDYILHAAMELPPDYFSNALIRFFATPELCTRFEKQYCDEVQSHSFSFCPAPDVILMDDEPLAAVKKKKHSSLVLGIQELKKGLDGFVSCANTGALVAASVLNLKPIDGIDRPALATVISLCEKRTLFLDVGALPEPSVQQLLQFAHLGAAFALTAFQKREVTVGLLNIGSECGKGTAQRKLLYRELQAVSSQKNAPFSFVGNIEPGLLFEGAVDVAVSDGFTGNIVLKTAEAVAARMSCAIEEDFEARGKRPDEYFGFSELRARFSQDMGTGAVLLGLKGYVAKCHGKASILAIQQALIAAKRHKTRVLDKRP